MALFIRKVRPIADRQKMIMHLNALLSPPYASVVGITPCQLYIRKNYSTMQAWQIFSFGGSEQLKLSTDIKVGALKSADDILVKVHASSINPFDIAVLGGYGATTLTAMQKLSCSGKSLTDVPGLLTKLAKNSFSIQIPFPLILGRDFSGVVVDAGQNAIRHYKPGDQVWGVSNPLNTTRGTHAEYTVVTTEDISIKPKTLSHIEAASLPYVICTAWSAIVTFGNMSERKAKGKRVLILGGSGGLGTFAIQLLKSWGAEVTTTCATDAINHVLTLGADVAIDYKSHDVISELQLVGGFDFILDGVKVEKSSKNINALMKLLKPNCNAHYVDLNSPMLRNNDNMGFPFGFAKSLMDFTPTVLNYAKEGKHYRWGFYMPSNKALNTVAKLVDEGKVQPVIERVCGFNEVPSAFDNVASGHNRGKTVIDMNI